MFVLEVDVEGFYNQIEVGHTTEGSLKCCSGEKDLHLLELHLLYLCVHQVVIFTSLLFAFRV